MGRLHEAAKVGNLAEVRSCIESEPKCVDDFDEVQNTAVYYAVEKGHHDVARYLMSEGNADVNKAWQGNFTSLMIAAHRGDVESISLVLEWGADVDAASSSRATTALMLAAHKNNIHAVRCLLIEGGADVNITNVDGYTVLMHAAVYGKHNIVRLLVSEGHADVNIVNKFGDTALLIAAKYGYVDVVRCLVTEGHADVHMTNQFGDSAMSYAYRFSRHAVVKFLRDGEDHAYMYRSGLVS